MAPLSREIIGLESSSVLPSTLYPWLLSGTGNNDHKVLSFLFVLNPDEMVSNRGTPDDASPHNDYYHSTTATCGLWIALILIGIIYTAASYYVWRSHYNLVFFGNGTDMLYWGTLKPQSQHDQQYDQKTSNKQDQQQNQRQVQQQENQQKPQEKLQQKTRLLSEKQEESVDKTTMLSTSTDNYNESTASDSSVITLIQPMTLQIHSNASCYKYNRTLFSVFGVSRVLTILFSISTLCAAEIAYFIWAISYAGQQRYQQQHHIGDHNSNGETTTLNDAAGLTHLHASGIRISNEFDGAEGSAFASWWSWEASSSFASGIFNSPLQSGQREFLFVVLLFLAGGALKAVHAAAVSRGLKMARKITLASLPLPGRSVDEQFEKLSQSLTYRVGAVSGVSALLWYVIVAQPAVLFENRDLILSHRSSASVQQLCQNSQLLWFLCVLAQVICCCLVLFGNLVSCFFERGGQFMLDEQVNSWSKSNSNSAGGCGCTDRFPAAEASKAVQTLKNLETLGISGAWGVRAGNAPKLRNEHSLCSTFRTLHPYQHKHQQREQHQHRPQNDQNQNRNQNQHVRQLVIPSSEDMLHVGSFTLGSGRSLKLVHKYLMEGQYLVYHVQKQVYNKTSTQDQQEQEQKEHHQILANIPCFNSAYENHQSDAIFQNQIPSLAVLTFTTTTTSSRSSGANIGVTASDTARNTVVIDNITSILRFLCTTESKSTLEEC